MNIADLDKLESELVKGSTMTSEHVDRMRALLVQLRALLAAR